MTPFEFESATCKVCQGQLVNQAEEIVALAPCGHCFHEYCLDFDENDLENNRCIHCPICARDSLNFVKLSVNRLDADAFRVVEVSSDEESQSSSSSSTKEQEQKRRKKSCSWMEYERMEEKLQAYQNTTRECELICQHFRRLESKFNEAHAQVKKGLQNTEEKLAESLNTEAFKKVDKIRKENVDLQRCWDNECARKNELVDEALRLEMDWKDQDDIFQEMKETKHVSQGLQILKTYYEPKIFVLKEQKIPRAKKDLEKIKRRAKKLNNKNSSANWANELEGKVQVLKARHEERNLQMTQLEEQLDTLRTMLEGKIFSPKTKGENDVAAISKVTPTSVSRPTTSKARSLVKPQKPATTKTKRKLRIQPIVPVLRRSKRSKRNMAN